MAWYWIVLIVLGAFFLLTFIIFISNLDMKLVAVIYKFLQKFHDKLDSKKEDIF
ncbi:MAG: hypothetical protein ACTTHG_01655 [Treponemataceae bacterium]